jgi:hypothetical protein
MELIDTTKVTTTFGNGKISDANGRANDYAAASSAEQQWVQKE